MKNKWVLFVTLLLLACLTWGLSTGNFRPRGEKGTVEPNDHQVPSTAEGPLQGGGHGLEERVPIHRPIPVGKGSIRLTVMAPPALLNGRLLRIGVEWLGSKEGLDQWLEDNGHSREVGLLAKGGILLAAGDIFSLAFQSEALLLVYATCDALGIRAEERVSLATGEEKSVTLSLGQQGASYYFFELDRSQDRGVHFFPQRRSPPRPIDGNLYLLDVSDQALSPLLAVEGNRYCIVRPSLNFQSISSPERHSLEEGAEVEFLAIDERAAPIVGAMTKIRVEEFGQSPALIRGGRSNSDGIIRLSGIPVGCPIRATISLDGVEGEEWELVLVRGEVRQLTWTPRGSSLVKVVCSNVEGSPVQGLKIAMTPGADSGKRMMSLADARSSIYAETDAEGLAQFEDVSAGHWMVGTPYGSRDYACVAEPVLLGVSRQSAVEVRLKVWDLFVEGIVSGGPFPPPGCTVQAYASGVGGRLMCQADVTGAFKLGPLPPGTAELSAHVLSSGQQSPSVLVSAGQTGVSLVVGAMRVITGIVHDAQGDPVDATVAAFAANASLPSVSYTSAEAEAGKLTLMVSQSGRYFLYAKAANGDVGVGVVDVREALNELQASIVVTPGHTLTLESDGHSARVFSLQYGDSVIGLGALPGRQSVEWAVPKGRIDIVYLDIDEVGELRRVSVDIQGDSTYILE